MLSVNYLIDRNSLLLNKVSSLLFGISLYYQLVTENLCYYFYLQFHINKETEFVLVLPVRDLITF